MRDQIEANKAVVLRSFEELWNQGKFEVMNEILAPNLAPQFQWMREFISAWRNSCPDARMVVKAMIAEGGLVVARYECEGWIHNAVWDTTVCGLSMAVPPTGKMLEDRGIDIFRIVDGKIVEFWYEGNKLELAQQLGVVPTSG